ncbi:F-box only protein 30-like [Acanthaster planci]|uniref:F-box only protein 30-like n=1 Tax=Acanthaster planci TaxID=133434 RepID=A0A8B7Z1P8_ACAPL|nr:F-box only protein 30-like [Acanthaster planci]
MPSEVDLHDHCQACYDSRCNMRLPACSIVPCELDCGARFHACKQAEHSLLCGNEKVACINAGYGCPLHVLRSQMSRHLAGCPASLVHCTMEWNRWPVCSSERQSHQPVQVLLDVNREQLDMALALRDQRMLTRSMRASVRTRKILTNNLNRRHPAVPLADQLTVSNGSTVKEFDEQRELENLLQDMHQWENATERKRSRSPAGLRQSICDELYRASQETVQQLSTAIHAMTGDSHPPSEKADFSLGKSTYPYIHCAHCERRKERMERLLDSHNAMKDCGEDSQSLEGRKPSTEKNAAPGDCHDESVHLRVIKDTLLGATCTNEEEQLHRPGQISSPSSRDVQQGYRSSSSSSEGSLNDVPMPALFVTPSTTGEVSAAPGRGHSKILVVEPPKMIPGSGVASFPVTNSDSPMQASLSLDLSLESITRYQAKPDSMYTFLCAQVFRRDEFASHFQNVHSDIHGGLNGWLEQRCPLAPYGCTYSQRRFFPGERKARIVHHEHLESFGVRVDGKGSSRLAESEDHSEVDADAMMEMEWVSEAVSSYGKDETSLMKENLKYSEDKTDAAVTNQSDSFPKAGGLTEESGVESKKMDQDANLIIENQASLSDISLHTMDQSGRSLGNCNDARLNESIVNHLEGPKPDTQISTENTPEVQGSHDSLDTDQTPDQLAVPSQSPSSQSELPLEPDHLSQLPLELLRYLTRFLDAFSLCNLSLTSKLLRQICCSVLEERGMVLLQWEKVNGRWDVAYRVWHFSTAFTPVLHWGFEDHPSLAVHLAKCPYNVQLQQSDPICVMIKLPETAATASLSNGKGKQDGEAAEAEHEQGQLDSDTIDSEIQEVE